MSTGSRRGPLPLLNVSEEEAWQWRQHRLATSRAYQVLLGYPVPFEDLVSADDAFEEVSGVQRLTLRAAEVLRQVFKSHARGETDVGPALRIGRIHQEVAHRFGTRYGIRELDQCYAELVRLLASAPGRLSGRRYQAAEVRFLGTVSDYASRYERYLMLGLHDEFPGSARPPVSFDSWASAYLDISLNLETVVADQLSMTWSARRNWGVVGAPVLTRDRGPFFHGEGSLPCEGVVPSEGRPRGSSGTETSGPRWRSTRAARLAPSWLGGGDP